MKRRLKFILYILMALILLGVIYMFTINLGVHSIIPISVSVLAIFILIYSFLIDFVIGHKSLEYSEIAVTIKRKDKPILTIPKTELKKIVVIYSNHTLDKSQPIEFIRFKYCKKTYWFEIKDEQKAKAFLEGLKYKKESDGFLRLILTILELFQHC